MLDTKAIDDEKKALQVLAEQVQQCKDDDERNLLIAEIQKTAAKLQELCDNLQAEADKIMENAPKTNVDFTAVVEVVLTPEQRKRVLERTGIDVPSVKIPDPTGKLTENMQHVEPSFVEQCAIDQAKQFKALVEDANAGIQDADGE